MTDWAAIRAEFTALQRWTYLNTATFGQVPRRAVAAVNAHWEHRDELATQETEEAGETAEESDESVETTNKA